MPKILAVHGSDERALGLGEDDKRIYSIFESTFLLTLAFAVSTNALQFSK